LAARPYRTDRQTNRRTGATHNAPYIAAYYTAEKSYKTPTENMKSFPESKTRVGYYTKAQNDC